MSGFIPPLISSSPPPLPEYDDEDDEDDVEFGMGLGPTMGDLSLEFSGTLEEKEKKDILDGEGRRLEIGGNSGNWRCEEQDSTSQDSGLCMASQGSEGMSPLPQSDDEEKGNQDSSTRIAGYQDSSTLKHSSTVMFNPEEETASSTAIVTRCDASSNVEIMKQDVEHPPADSEQKKSDNDDVDDLDLPTPDPDINNSSNDIDDFDTWHSINHNDSYSIESTVKTDDIGSEEQEEEEEISSLNPVLGNVFNPTSIYGECSEHNETIDSESLCDKDSITKDEKQYFNVDDIENGDEFKQDDEEDDFGNFNCVTIPNSDLEFTVVNPNPHEKEACDVFKDETIEESIDSSIDNFGDFSDAGNSNPNIEGVADCKSDSDICGKRDSGVDVNNEDKDNMGEFINYIRENKKSSDNIVNEDDDEFSDFTQSTVIPSTSLAQDSQDCKFSFQPEVGLEQIFPQLPKTESKSIQNDILLGSVWKHLCPLESSPALTFQWPNSKAHNKLLAALSIDSRNILFGPSWNPNRPIFAANLGTNPLQPVKVIEGGSANSVSPVPSSESSEAVPDAIFDWVGSGLTNPLDCPEKPNEAVEDATETCKPSVNVETLKILSIEADQILSSLPDLNFIRKTYIEVLISKG